jgi:hypothetical protein
MKLLPVALLSVALCIGRAGIGTPPNALSPTEKNEGFELLFDGKSMSNFNVQDGQKRWAVVDGAIKSNSKEGAGNLLSREDFRQLRAEGGISSRS